MGLFSFLKNAGANLTSNKSKATPKESEMDKMANEIARKQKETLLVNMAESLSIPIEALSVDFYDGVVTVYGTVESQADREKVILTLGNVRGVATVDDRMNVVTPEPEAEFYEVQSGDSLSKIAKKYYGNAGKYTIIFEANQPMLKDPNLIYPGQMLRIPKL